MSCAQELDQQRRANKDLQTDFGRLKEILKQRDSLIQESGLVLYTDNEKTRTGGGDGDDELIKSVLPAALVTPETAKLLDMLGEGTIDDKLHKALLDKRELADVNARLQSELDDERERSAQLEKKLATSVSKIQSTQESSQDLHEMQRNPIEHKSHSQVYLSFLRVNCKTNLGLYTKEINELKLRFQKIEHENIIIKQDVSCRVSLSVTCIVSSIHESNSCLCLCVCVCAETTTGHAAQVLADQLRRARADRTPPRQGETRRTTRSN